MNTSCGLTMRLTAELEDPTCHSIQCWSCGDFLQILPANYWEFGDYQYGLIL
jgi:hypothetical protein